jgi:hypothetical protein
MNTNTSKYNASFQGLGTLMFIFFALAASPLLYFIIHLMLGNVELFHGTPIS